MICSFGILPEFSSTVQKITQHRPSGRKKFYLFPRLKIKNTDSPAVSVTGIFAKNTALRSVISVGSKLFVY